MKKFLAFLATAILTVVCALGVSACNNNGGGDGKLSVYVPDGAPAISVATLANSDTFDVHVIDANIITTKVTGSSPIADIAIMPVNAAVKLLGNGNTYRMLGTVTHGNLFLLKQQGEEDISSPADLAKLEDKTVGVINLANVPGLTFKTILNDNNMLDLDKVRLVDVKALEVVPTNSDCDYFVVPEPVATTKTSSTSLSVAGSLQTLYGGENGYPQAVAVAKKSVIENNADEIDEFMHKFEVTEEWLKLDETTGAEIAEAIDKMTDGDLAHQFNANNLTKPVISNCGIHFVPSAQCKEEINLFIQKFNAVSNNAWGSAADDFFYEKN